MEVFIAILLLIQSSNTNRLGDEADAAQIEELPDPVTGEYAVDPYIKDNKNAGAKPFQSTSLSAEFGGKQGIKEMTDRLIDISMSDPRISDIFKGQDEKRLRRTLFEQFCYILAAGCDYTGRDMREAHKNMGLERDDLNALVENLQKAMTEKKIAFRNQNRFLAKLAPMEADVLQK